MEWNNKYFWGLPALAIGFIFLHACAVHREENKLVAVQDLVTNENGMGLIYGTVGRGYPQEFTRILTIEAFLKRFPIKLEVTSELEKNARGYVGHLTWKVSNVWFVRSLSWEIRSAESEFCEIDLDAFDFGSPHFESVGRPRQDDVAHFKTEPLPTGKLYCFYAIGVIPNFLIPPDPAKRPIENDDEEPETEGLVALVSLGRVKIDLRNVSAL